MNLTVLDNYLSLHSTTANQLIHTKKTETLSEVEHRRHTHWVIKSLTIGFIRDYFRSRHEKATKCC